MQKYKDRSIYLLPGGIAMGRKENNFQFKSGFIQKFSPEDQSGDHISLNAYHYTSPEAFLSIIQNHSIRFTDIRYMNDRAEGIYFVKLLLDFVEKNRGNYPHFEEVINQLLKGNDLEKIQTLATTEIQYEDPQKYVGVHNQKLLEGFCTKHGLIVPFLNVSFSKEAIQRITIAPMVEYEIAKKSIRELLECQQIKNVQIRKSTIPIRF